MPNIGLVDRLRRGLLRTRQALTTPIADLVARRGGLSKADLETIESGLLAADVGVPVTRRIMAALEARASELRYDAAADAMRGILRQEIVQALSRPAQTEAAEARPQVVFLVGVNGVGKTTCAGKLAYGAVRDRRSAMLCAADTFRAAAAEQLAIWAERAGCPLHRGSAGADPSAVLTDALRSARLRACDTVLVDTAGRLHTKGNLMTELVKMVRVASREVAGAPHETLLVLDATVGSNGLAQATEFARAVPLTGLILAKMDGTAKGGVALSIVDALNVPIKYVGVGEELEDLLPFDAPAFADALLDS